MKEKILEFVKNYSVDMTIENLRFESYISNLDKNARNDFFNTKDEHYTFLSNLSYYFENSVFYDIGTFRGLSALALSSNLKNKVISYDIKNKLEIDLPDNIEFILGDFYQDPGLLDSALIFFDVDPHGQIENNFVDYLIENNYRGITIFDDIQVNNEMIKFWDSISLEKLNITHIGHGSGTGIVFFD